MRQGPLQATMWVERRPVRRRRYIDFNTIISVWGAIFVETFLRGFCHKGFVGRGESVEGVDGHAHGSDVNLRLYWGQFLGGAVFKVGKGKVGVGGGRTET
jgi:hypothetical protein